jgi:3-oxoacyl-[acyl-carrier protein] reductase
MKMELEGRVALVTGGSKGMGRATAAALAGEGCEICLLARDPEMLVDAAAAIAEQNGREVLTVTGDVARAELAQETIDRIVERFGRIDILVNNAGGPPMGSFLDHDAAAWDAALQTNLLSVVGFTRAAAPHMIANAWGRVINITSTLAKEPTGPMVLSASARAAVSAFSKAVSAELAPHNVTINTVCPGGVLTDRLVGLIEAGAAGGKVSYDEQLKASQSLIPMDRFAAPEEVADVIVFLASQRGSYVTGTSLMVDGALTKSAF